MKKHLNFGTTFGNVWVIIIFSYLILFYYTFVFIYWENKAESKYNPMFHKSHFTLLVSTTDQTLFILLHIFLVMFLWSFITVIITDPGQVPLYWVRKHEEQFMIVPRDFIWTLQNKEKDGTVQFVISLNRNDVIIVQHVTDAFSTWITIAHGSTTALASIIESSSYYCSRIQRQFRYLVLQRYTQEFVRQLW